MDLQQLPWELLLRIGEFLTVEERAGFASSSSLFADLASDPILWKSSVAEKFLSPPSNHSEVATEQSRAAALSAASFALLAAALLQIRPSATQVTKPGPSTGSEQDSWKNQLAAIRATAAAKYLASAASGSLAAAVSGPHLELGTAGAVLEELEKRPWLWKPAFALASKVEASWTFGPMGSGTWRNPDGQVNFNDSSSSSLSSSPMAQALEGTRSRIRAQLGHFPATYPASVHCPAVDPPVKTGYVSAASPRRFLALEPWSNTLVSLKDTGLTLVKLPPLSSSVSSGLGVTPLEWNCPVLGPIESAPPLSVVDCVESQAIAALPQSASWPSMTAQRIASAAYDAASDTLVTGAANGVVATWSVRAALAKLDASGREEGGVLKPLIPSSASDVPRGFAATISVAATGSLVVAGSVDGTVKLWAAREGQDRVAVFGEPSAKHIDHGSDSLTEAGSKLAPRGHSPWVSAVAVEGSIVTSAAYAVRLYDAEALAPTRVLWRDDGEGSMPVGALVVEAAGARVWAGDAGGVVTGWDVRIGEEESIVAKCSVLNKDGIRALTTAGQWGLVCGDESGWVSYWDRRMMTGAKGAKPLWMTRMDWDAVVPSRTAREGSSVASLTSQDHPWDRFDRAVDSIVVDSFRLVVGSYQGAALLSLIDGSTVASPFGPEVGTEW